MLRKLGCFVMTLGIALPVWAGETPASISGYVRNSNGVPQMGAMVEVLNSAVHRFRAFTDGSGFYSVSGLLPGSYNLKVSAPYFMPALRQRVGLRAGASVVVNVTLSTLFDAVNLAPLRDSSDNDDWKWVLRSSANRPILRLQDDGPMLASAEQRTKHDLTGTLSFLAGSPSEGFGSTSDMTTGFAVEKSLFSAGTVAVRGNLGYADGSAAAVLRASYSHKLANGSQPELALTLRNLPAPDIGLRNATLQALALSAADSFTMGDVLELKFGSELQTIQFMGRVTAFRPFGSAGLHLSPTTVLGYRYATSEPDQRADKGFDSAPADLSESQPRMSMAGYGSELERAHHHEISLSQQAGKNNFQVAMYADRINDPALTGVGEFLTGDGEILPDPYSGTFTYRGRDLDTQGVRLVAQRKVTSNITATAEYAYGGVLDFNKTDVSLDNARQSTVVRGRHSAAAKVSCTMPSSKTSWIASYRWVSGSALTPVDMFDASPGQSDAFLSLFLRQPIPGTGFLPGHMDALIDIRNLLAQGYVPVMGQDGHTVYLVQAARSIRGGVAFTF